MVYWGCMNVSQGAKYVTVKDPTNKNTVIKNFTEFRICSRQLFHENRHFKENQICFMIVFPF